MTREEIENIDIKVFEEKAVVMSAEDYTKLWAYVHQLQKENEELKSKCNNLEIKITNRNHENRVLKAKLKHLTKL